MNKKKRIVPAFATEGAGAEWWFKNRSIHGRELLAAVKSGEAQALTKGKLPERMAASRKPAAPVVAGADSAGRPGSCPKAGEEKGLPYQMCIKSLLHERPAERERRNLE
jgi:hypothetical protein